MDTAQTMELEAVAPLDAMLHEQLLDRQEQTCMNAVAAFRNGTERNADLTMLALKYTGAAI